MTMLVEQLFTRIGVTTRRGKTRVRFTNNPEREIILVKDGHDDITILDLPQPMTKPEAVTWLMGRKDEFEAQKDRIAIDEANDRYNHVHVPKSRAKVTATPSMEDLKSRAADKVAEEA